MLTIVTIMLHKRTIRTLQTQKRKPWPETGVKEPGLPTMSLLGGEQHRS